MTDLSTTLRTLRQSRNITLARLASGTDLSVSYMSDLERGRTSPSIKTLDKIARFYGLVLQINFNYPLLESDRTVDSRPDPIPPPEPPGWT